MKKVLVTGGLGFIGSHTVVALVEAGFEPVIVDNLSNSRIEILSGIESITQKKIPFFEVDVRDTPSISELCEQQHFVGILHFAAYKSVFESEREPLKYYDNNLNGLISLLKCVKEYEIPAFIFSSSCTVYGQADELPISEQTPLKKPESVYGNTKKIGEEIIQDVFKQLPHSKAVLLRYFNPIGAHPSGLIGELPLGVPDNLIPYITQTAAGIREQLSIFGNDYPTRDGTAIRDYIDIMDLAEAHVLALKKILEHPFEQSVEIYNLGTEKGYTVKEIVEAFEKVNDVKLNYRYAPRRAGDITAAYSDSKKAKQELGWSIKTSVEQSLENAWKWQLRLKK